MGVQGVFAPLRESNLFLLSMFKGKVLEDVLGDNFVAGENEIVTSGPGCRSGLSLPLPASTASIRSDRLSSVEASATFMTSVA